MVRQVEYGDIAQTLAAVENWIKSIHIGDRPVFSPASLWTKDLVEELHNAFVEHPDSSYQVDCGTLPIWGLQSRFVGASKALSEYWSGP